MTNCSLLDSQQFSLLNDPHNNDPWLCPCCIVKILSFIDLDDSKFLLLHNDVLDKASDDLRLYPDKSFTQFYQFVSEDNDETDIFNNTNSKYYDIHEFNQICTDSKSSLVLLHTNLASIYKHYDNLLIMLSQLNLEFDVVAITEHKISGNTPIRNIELPGYHEFIFDSSL